MSNPYAVRYAAFDFGERFRGGVARPIAGSVIKYHSVYDFPGWENKALDWITEIIQRFGRRNVLEVGSGANPTLPPSDIAGLNLRYTANDISAQELAKADSRFEGWVCDLSKDAIPPERAGSFDLIFSRMVNEHVADGQVYHANIHKLLKPGGISAHCFSTLYCLPFLINRLIPDSLTGALLNLFAPRDAHKTAKFQSYYSWSRGPSAAMLKRFDSLGFDVIDYRGYFGHGYYSRVPFLNKLEGLKARLLLSHPTPLLCSYGMLIARKRE